MIDLDKKANSLAQEWLHNSQKYQSISDKIYAAKMDKFFRNSGDKSFVITMMDKAFRPSKSKDIAKIIGKIPDLNFLNFFEKRLVDFYNFSRGFAYQISVPLLKQFIYFTTAKYVLFGSGKVLEKRISKNLKNGLKTNLNRVGEMLLSEEDAQKRIQQYVRDLENPAVNCISIKISTIDSQISSIAFEQVVEDLVAKISIIYQAAKDNSYTCLTSGKKFYKLVNFDMEEYRDLAITTEAFIRTLSKTELQDLTAGIALQAYLPDSFLYLQKITKWAQEKVKNGGAPARVRIVKGANMDMELFEARERGWPLAPFATKALTDANYKLMAEYALQKENINAVKIGIASHNIFDIAYIYLCAQQNGALDSVTFEMLSGMSDSTAKMLAKKLGLNVLLYTPFSEKENFVSAIGYLVRRLDENTSRDNYLRYINGLERNPENLKMLEEQFEESLQLKNKNNFTSNRQQNRLQENFEIDFVNFGKSYQSEPDTDFSLPENYEFAKRIQDKWQNISGFNDLKNSTIEEAQQVLKCAAENDTWQNFSEEKRLEIIAKTIRNYKERRGDLIGMMMRETSKTMIESDAEISEAIDFGNYYSYSFLQMRSAVADVSFKAKKVVLVLSPWNFPVAIPTGGIFAALIAGSNVIFKPSNFSTLIGCELAKCFWDAGVPRDVLQLVPSFDSVAAMALTKSKLIDMIVFTGSTNTALAIIQGNPTVKMIAETGGKNVTIVTKYADKDQAIKNLLQSAFSNSGQKCSATSILALETEIYQDVKFLDTLVAAVKSLRVGGAWDLKTRINPLIRKPLADLEYAFTQLEEGESWLLKPQSLNESQTLWSPAIKIGTKLGTKSHVTEFFGPVLTVMPIENLVQGIELVNSTGYGLTSALESLNEEEQVIWQNSIQAGNLYINRPTTGAIVERQPFGGMNKSAFGSGIKAGGLNYIYQFFDFKNAVGECDIFSTMKNYGDIYAGYFSQEIDYQKIRGQSNVTRFLQLSDIAIRGDSFCNIHDLILAIFAAKLCVKEVSLSVDNDEVIIALEKFSAALLQNVNFAVQSDEEFSEQMVRFKRVRIISNRALNFFKEKAAKSAITVIGEEVIYQGRVELLHYLQEQSISNNYHRFGYVDRGGDRS